MIHILKTFFNFFFSRLFAGGVAPVRFNGRDLYVPGYYSKRNISALNQGAASGSNLIIIGKSAEGIPFNATTEFPNAEDRVNYITNSIDLNSILVEGEGYDACRIALSPSNQPGINGAPLIMFIRMDKATQSTLTLENSDTVPDDVLDLKSLIFGSNANQVQLKIVAGTNDGKKITIKYKDNPIEEEDDLLYSPFTISYGGAGTAVELLIDPTTGLTTTVTGASGEDLNIVFSTYNTIQAVIDAINNHSSGSYTASIVDASLLDFDPTELDEVVTADAVDLVSADYTVEAELQACIDFLNKSNYLKVVGITSGKTRRTLAVIPYTFLTGATNGTAPDQTDWQTAIDMCQSLDASFVHVVTSDASVHAYLSSHVTYMNNDGRNERQGICGSSSSDTISTKKAASQAINNLAIGYYGAEAKLFDKNGIETIYPGYISAAYLGGIQAGNTVTLPPTNKQLNLLGQKETYKISELNDFIKNGIVVHNPSEIGGTRIVRSVTTYQASNIIANEFSAVRTILFITKDHRSYVEQLVGIAGDNTSLASIKNKAVERLEYYQESNFFVVDPDKGDAFRNVNIEVVGDVFKLTYEATLVLPVNFILVTHNFTVIGQA